MKQDKLYANKQTVVDFAFNDKVVDVFPDMIRRSVPGYETVISLLGVLAGRYARSGTSIYDLGCSLGAATLSMYRQTSALQLDYIGVDNSAAMVKRCQSRLQRHMPEASLQIRCEDLENTVIDNASVVVINFTLQFLSREARLALLEKIHRDLIPGGVLILSEKLEFADVQENDKQTDWHLAFKRANGYSDLEISQKRAALENVMIPDTAQQHYHRFQQAGFAESYQWFQAFNFASFIAIKA